MQVEKLVEDLIQAQLPAAYWRPISELERWKKNPRHNDKAVPAVARSIRRYGFVAPVVIWTSKNRLVAGHTRLLAMDKLLAEDPAFVPRDAPGAGLVPVRHHEFTDESEAAAYALADNRLSEIATWDEDLLGEVLAEIRDLDERLLLETGFESEEIERLIREAQGSVDGEPVDDSEPPAAPEPSDALLAKWGVLPGQLWVVEGQRGTCHRLLCGDCRRPEDMSRLLGETRAAVAFTSPPYASQRAYDRASEFKPIPPEEYITWFEAVQANVRAHLAPDGSWLVNIKAHSEDGQRHLYVMDLVQAHVRRWGWRFVDDLAWVRAGVPGSWPNRFKNGWEPVFHFSLAPQIKFRPEAVGVPTDHAFRYAPGQQVGGRSKSNALRSERGNGTSPSGSGLLGKERPGGFHEGLALPSNVIEVGSGGGQVSGQHPAEFPVGLPRWFLLAYSDPGDAVIEPFAGSGATLLAAEQTGRAGYGMEISPRYTAVILERLAQMGLSPRLVEKGS